VLAERLGRKVVNAGVPGEISAEGLARLPELLEKHRPALVLISHGGNDILRKIDPRQTKANLKRMIELVRAQGGEVVLIAIPKPALLPSAASFYEELAEEMAVPVELDIVTHLQKSPKYKSDPIHFNAEGYRLMAEAVAELLEESGALKD
jgi:lysophospholipase L1-like esterase